MSTMVGLALLAALVAVAVGVWTLARVQRLSRRDAALRAALQTFAPVRRRLMDDPRELLAWYPVARASRMLFPETYDELDRATGDTFPFSSTHVEKAHERWTANWLAWEREHDDEYKVKASDAKQELEKRGDLDSPLGKARLAALEREQLERYQDRYAEYVTVAKALADLEAAVGAEAKVTD